MRQSMDAFRNLAAIVMVFIAVRYSSGQAKQEKKIRDLDDKAFRLFVNQDYFEAAKKWSKALELAAVSYGTNSGRYATLLSDLGSAYSAMRKYDKAISAFRSALKIVESLPQEKAKQNLATICVNYGETLFWIGRLAASEKLLLRALSLRTLPTTALLLGKLYLARNDYKNARRMFVHANDITKARIRNKSAVFPLYHRYLATLEIEMNDFKKAQQHLNAYVRLVPRARQYVELEFGIIALISGNRKKAQEIFQSILESKTDIYVIGNANYYLAIAFYLNGRLGMSMKHANQAISAQKSVFGKNHPSIGESLLLWSAICAGQGQVRLAMKIKSDAQEIFRCNPKYVRVKMLWEY